jgi:hypothetical protein
MRRSRPTALRRTLPADPALGVIRDPIHDQGEATSNLAPANKNGAYGQEPPKTAAYVVTTDLPGDASITEAELRAIEVLLGRDLKDIIAGNGH